MCTRNVGHASGIALVLASFLMMPGTVHSRPQQTTIPSSGVGKYNGPGGCAASNCHGSVKPKNLPGIRISQNEFSIWASQDKHARSYSVLSNPVSMRMGKILKIEQPNKSEKCLVCHALYVPTELRATTFQLDDGVSCENCHGPAVGWLGPHTAESWQHLSPSEKSKYGMYDTRNLVARTEKCVSCHVGTAEKQVDHEMIAAGHPDLTFELDSFSAAMPRHWKTNREERYAWLGVQELGDWTSGAIAQVADPAQPARSQSNLAGLCRAGLFRLSPLLDWTERQLAAYHRRLLSGTSCRHTSVEWLTISCVSLLRNGD